MSAVTTTPDAGPGAGEGDDRNLTLLEHLKELRYRLMVCAGALFFTMIVAFVFATDVMRWMRRPAESKVGDFELIFTQPLEAWATYFRVGLLVGVALAMPVFIWQLLAFVGPGLTKNEKRWAFPIVIGASLMFVAGCAFAYYIELPPALGFLLDSPGGVARPLISVQSYVDFVTRLMMVTGLVFETPFVVMGLAKIGVVTSRKLWAWWRFAIVGAFLISAVVTPSVDPYTQTLVAVPMIVLYFAGIGMAKLVEKNPIIPHA